MDADTSEQMFLNLSPLAAHLNESVCSLSFATKTSTQKVLDECAPLILCAEQANNTQIVTAKRQVNSSS